MIEQIRGQNIHLGNAKIMVDVLIPGVGINERKMYRIFLVFVYQGVKRGYVCIFNEVRLFFFAMQGHRPGSSSIKGFTRVEGWYHFQGVSKCFQLGVDLLFLIKLTFPAFYECIPCLVQHGGFLEGGVVHFINGAVFVAVIFGMSA